MAKTIMDINNDLSEAKNNKKSILKEVFEWIQVILFAVALAFIIRGFIFEQALVDGSSMQDTLQDNQRLIIYKLGYNFHAPNRGDIIILEYQKGLFKYLPLPDPKEVDYIKRVIALPGDEVDIKEDGFVYINGEKQYEPYAKGITRTNGMDLPITIPSNKVFVLGDNREYSSDSRVIGLIDFDRIRGKAVFRIFPLQNFGSIYKNYIKVEQKDGGK